MSYRDGWAALNLDMPSRVPRTEYSVESYHTPMLRLVSGLPLDENSPGELRHRASLIFRQRWHYDFCWSTLVSSQPFGALHTRMGHAAYAENSADLDRTVSCPFDDPEQVLAFDPAEAFGDVDIREARDDFSRHYAGIRRELPEEVATTGVYTTLVSGLIDLFGWDMLLTAAGMDPEGFGAVADRYARWMQGYMEALAESDAECVMIHDDICWTGGPFIHPEWYRRYVFPNYKRYFAPILESGKKLVYTSDGNYTAFVDDLADCGVSAFVLEPFTDMKYIAEKYGRTHAFIGNADTRILLNGTREEIENEVRRCMDIGKACPGFFMAVGNHIPANTPVESCLIYNDAYERMARR